ncbi:MAG: DUF4432 family protein [Pirellulaceae bacterium]
MSAEQPLIERARQLSDVHWHEAPPGCFSHHRCDGHDLHLKFGSIASGRGAGVSVVLIDTGPMQLTVLPTRGMGIWQVVCDGVPFKWNSPVTGPIHPSLVPQFDPNGLGWLEGFDEFMVRCGMASNGAPDFDESGQLLYPLHGRIANTPADRIWSEVDGDECVLGGDLHEQRLFFHNLRLTSRIRVNPGCRSICIEDTITNLSGQTSTSQMLYHVNIGKPVLAGSCRLHIPCSEMAPRDAVAAAWPGQPDRCDNAKSGFQEVVDFYRMHADDQHETAVLLENPQSETGLGLIYDTRTLPCFVVWKNFAGHQDGYVLGLEPATNFPNTRTFEGLHGRVTTLEPGQSITHRLEIWPLVGSGPLSDFGQRVAALKTDLPPVIHEQPRVDWSPQV